MQRNLISGRPATAVLIALVASVTLAACGGSGSSSASTSTASATNAGLKFAACVRAHGVPDYPDPRSSAGQATGNTGNTGAAGPAPSESSAVVQRAEDECQQYSLPVQGPRFSTAQLAKIKAGALAMATCMRAHGVPNYPDPTVGPGPGGHGFELSVPTAHHSGVNPTSPAFQDANTKCSSLLNSSVPSNNS